MSQEKIETKRLKRLLLVNWHTFIYEMVDFGEINLICGPNGSGKTTLLDAINTILLSDTGRSYNKSGNTSGKRSLDDYLAGTSGEEGQERLREGNFTSIVALEFEDTKTGGHFVSGASFDVESYGKKKSQYFTYTGKIPEDGFVHDGFPLRRAEMKAEINRIKKPRTKVAFNEAASRNGRELYARLGGLQPEQFKDVFRNTVAFKAEDLKDIKSFVGKYICNSMEEIDLSQNLNNIRDYEEMERQAQAVKKRAASLQAIEDVFQKESELEEQLRRARYISLRAQKEEADDEKTQAQTELSGREQEEKALNEQLDSDRRTEAQLENERDSLQIEIGSSNVLQTKKRLEDEISALKTESDVIEAQAQEAREYWFNNIRVLGRPIVGRFLEDKLPEEAIFDESRDFKKQISKTIREEIAKLPFKFANILQGEGDSFLIKNGERYFDEFLRKTESLKLEAALIDKNLKAEETNLNERVRELTDEISQLEQGITPLPKDVQKLKEILRDETGVELNVLAEVCEINDPAWGNVLEGFLGKRRYYFIPDESLVSRSLKIYDRHKRNLGGYNGGIVNVKEFRKSGRPPMKGSLAEEILTENPALRGYLNQLLGDTIKCEAAADLEKVRKGITREGMRHTGGAFFPMNPRDWQHPMIGQEGRKRRLEQCRQEKKSLEDLRREIRSLREQIVKLHFERFSFNTSENARYLRAITETERLPELEKEIADRKDQIASLDLSAIEALQAQLRAVRLEIDTIRRRRETAISRIGQIKAEKTELAQKISRLDQTITELTGQIEAEFDLSWIDEIGNEEYQRAKKRSEAVRQKFSQAYSNRIVTLTSQKDRAHQELVHLRRDYILEYNAPFSEEDDGNEHFTLELKKILENELPQYQKNFAEMKKKTEADMRENYISKMRYNIQTARARIQEHNQILSKIQFGTDRYHFLIKPRDEYLKIYRMIMSDLNIGEGPTIMSQAIQEQYPDEMDSLFRLLLEEERKGGVNAFKDYRTFLDFDIEIMQENGKSRKLSKVQGKLSGGETQAPYYVSMITSLASVYREGHDRLGGTLRLAAFDEAFSKMDGERTDAAIRLLRDMQMQSIIVAPLNKAGDLIRHADQVYVITSGEDGSSVDHFTKKDLVEMMTEGIEDD